MSYLLFKTTIDKALYLKTTLQKRILSRLLTRDLQVEPRLSWKDALWVLVPAGIWAGITLLRPSIIEPICAQRPSPCRPELVFWPDRLFLGWESSWMDELSFMTQYLAGAFAFGIPLLWGALSAIHGRWPVRLAVIRILTDWVILLQITILNGLAMEATRLFVQRPRPFLYSDPVRLGAQPAHYTSFYSGHTSFTAAASVGLLIVLMSRNAKPKLLTLLSRAGVILVILTGLGRVFSGRHFPTDVLFAVLAGSAVAYFVSYFHRPKACLVIES